MSKYNEFINSIRESRENKYFKYSECHHIIPRCLGGTDDEENLIYLTYREHFIAHKILAEENPDNYYLFLAYWRMCNGSTKVATPEEYEEASKEWSRQLSNRCKGKKLSEEWRANISKSHKGYRWTEEHRINNSNARKGKPLSESHRKNLSISHIGHKDSEETKRKKSESLKGKQNSLGYKHTNRIYRFTCIICDKESIGRSSMCRYCDTCKEERK